MNRTKTLIDTRKFVLDQHSKKETKQMYNYNMSSNFVDRFGGNLISFWSETRIKT